MNDIEILKTVAAALQAAGQRLIDPGEMAKLMSPEQVIASGQVGLALGEAAVMCRNAAAEIDKQLTEEAEQRLRDMGIEPLPENQRHLTHLIPRRDATPEEGTGAFTLCCGYNAQLMADEGDLLTSSRDLASCQGRDHQNLVASARATQRAHDERQRSEQRIDPARIIAGEHAPFGVLRPDGYDGHVHEDDFHGKLTTYAGSRFSGWASHSGHDTHCHDEHGRTFYPKFPPHTGDPQVTVAVAMEAGQIPVPPEASWSQAVDPREPRDFSPGNTPQAQAAFWQRVAMALVAQVDDLTHRAVEIPVIDYINADGRLVHWMRDPLTGHMQFWLTEIPRS